MTRRFLENAGQEVAALPPGLYDIEVADAHTNDKAPTMVFLDLKVLNGPDAGKVTNVGLYVPTDDKQGAQFHFNNKVGGFAAALRAVDWSVISDDDELATVADTLIGLRVSAELGVQGEDAGQYAGKQELVKTKPLDGAVAAAPAPAVVAAPAPVAAAPVAVVEAAPVAAAPVAAPVAPPAPAVATDEVPF